ncbi:hypothetical protein M885DRAFT_504485 [Pelagophyceae sp. CCMP2097]|nr:hypothetical protein M885DRAFT_504485 [Pelagophyceae sp. CCMP2097]
MSFGGAPFTRLACVGSAICTLLFSPQLKRELAFDLGRILANGEVWRVVTRHAAYDTVGECVAGSVALYGMRKLERLMGPRKFGAFVVVVLSAAAAAETAIVVLLSRPESAASLRPASGPYALVFGLFALYYAYVPAVQPRLFGLLGCDVSDKHVMYVVGLQLLSNKGLDSAVAAATGAAAGALYLSDALGLQRLALPQRLFGARRPRPAAPRRNATPARPPLHDARRLFPTPFTDDAPFAESPFADAPVAPTEAHVEQLTNMGFDRDLATDALRTCHDDVEAAANRLLAG